MEADFVAPRRRSAPVATRGDRADAEYRAELDLAPTDLAPIVYYNAKDGNRCLEVMPWGLIPYWAKEIKMSFSTINAQAEEVDTKPAFANPELRISGGLWATSRLEGGQNLGNFTGPKNTSARER